MLLESGGSEEYLKALLTSKTFLGVIGDIKVPKEAALFLEDCYDRVPEDIGNALLTYFSD